MAKKTAAERSLHKREAAYAADIALVLDGALEHAPFHVPELPEAIRDAYEDRWPAGAGVPDFGRLLRVHFPGWAYDLSMHWVMAGKPADENFYSLMAVWEFCRQLPGAFARVYMRAHPEAGTPISRMFADGFGGEQLIREAHVLHPEDITGLKSLVIAELQNESEDNNDH